MITDDAVSNHRFNRLGGSLVLCTGAILVWMGFFSCSVLGVPLLFWLWRSCVGKGGVVDIAVNGKTEEKASKMRRRVFGSDSQILGALGLCKTSQLYINKYRYLS